MVWRGKGKEREPSGVWRWKRTVSAAWEVGRGRDERKRKWGEGETSGSGWLG